MLLKLFPGLFSSTSKESYENTAQKMKFSIKNFFGKCEEEIEEILDGKLPFFAQ